MRSSPGSLLLVGFLAFQGCETPGTPDSVIEVRDSAGIRIVETLTPIIEDGDGWQVSANPTLHISTPPFEAGYVLHWMRGAVRLSDLRIVALSESSKELFFFDSAGVFLKAVGREGDGPGEFRRPFLLDRLSGDTLMVTERSAARISWFSPDGEYLRGLSPDFNEVQRLIPEGYRRSVFSFYVPSGSFLLGVANTPTSFQETPLGKRWRDTFGLFGVREDGTSSFFLGPFKGFERFYLEPGLGGIAFFGAAPEVAVHFDPVRIVIGDTRLIDLRVFSESGQLQQIIRDAVPPDPIQPEDIEWERWNLVSFGKQSGEPERWNRLADAIPIPDQKPAFETLLVDCEGYLWLKEYSSHRPDPVRYRIYSPGGMRVGTVRLPGFFRVLDIGADYVLGLGYDMDYVETRQMFALSRPATR